MAERRMFSKKIVGSARFLRLPPTARLLYYDLGMQADDDGVVEAFTVLQMTHADEADLNALCDRGLIRILNDDLVSLIIDWKTNNLIKKDRYRPSFYSDLLSGTQVEPVWNPSGTQVEPVWNPSGTQVEPQDRIGKYRLDQYSIGKARGKEPEPFDPNEFDSIREEFIGRFSREPDRAFLPSIKAHMAAGKSEQDVIEVIRQSAQRHPHNPEAYILAALKQYESKPQELPDADRPLEQWEQDWLAEVQRRRAQRGEEQDD